MRLLEHSYEAPAENLALDEVLLDEAEAGRVDETLRFWTSPVPFVVLGLSQAIDGHVLREACERDGVPILRRCSAGGCVLQGPGCLNYSLILRTDRPGCETIHASYRSILGAVARALQALGSPVQPAGISDLAVGGKKVSGSAQRRRKRFFLHHGTLLLDFDIALCSRYLKEPLDQPDYRARRDHESFISNLDLGVLPVSASVSSVFQAHTKTSINRDTESEVRSLVEVKYARHDWIFRA